MKMTTLPTEALANSRDAVKERHGSTAAALVAAASHSLAEEGGVTSPKEAASQARELLRTLRIFEAAAHIEAAEKEEEASPAGSPKECNSKEFQEFRAALDMQLRALGAALQRLAGHPGLREQPAPCGAWLKSSSDTFLGVSVPVSPASLSTPGTDRTDCFKMGSGNSKPDVLKVAFDLDDNGRKVEAVVEFFPDGSASIEWAAFELPIPMPYVLCLVHEVDLLGEVVPFIVNSSVLHQFPWNEADRLVRVVSKPPIPFVSGLEGVAQRFCFDLLDTPWQAFALVEQGPKWESAQGQKGAQGQHWRQVPKPPPFQKGLRQVDMKSVVALGQPVGPEGKLTTILFSAKGKLKVPRNMLPDWLVAWLVKTTGRLVYQQALERVASFDSTKFGPRLKDSKLYAELHQRIAKFAEGRQAAAAAS